MSIFFEYIVDLCLKVVTVGLKGRLKMVYKLLNSKVIVC